MVAALKQSKIDSSKAKDADKKDPVQVSRTIQVFFLFFDSLMFNIYSKIKTTELLRL